MVKVRGSKLTSLQPQQHSTENEIEEGLDFLLSHFNQDRLFPRKIQTSKSEGRQIEVFSKQEAFFYFKRSNFKDCRINAFPSYTEYKGIQRYPPDLIFIDIDRSNFKDDKSFENALSKTKKNIKEKFNSAIPTINNSGNGYHVIQPIVCLILEQIEQFQKYKNKNKNFFISQEFLRFAKNYLSNDKADKNNYPSFKSCQIRVPGSINGKYFGDRNRRLSGNFKVKILQKWNGVRPPIPREFLEDFRTYLEQKITDMDNNSDNNKNNHNYNNNSNNNYTLNYKWIEKLLQTPIEDYRKIVLWKILCPYLVNIIKLSPYDSFQILNDWLKKCNSLRKLDFNPNQKIKDNLKHVRSFYPLGIKKLKTDEEYNKLYQILKEKIELNTSKNREVGN